MRGLLLLLGFSLLVSPTFGTTVDADSDNDGLYDYQEIHKYFTDPHKVDSDGDSIPDGDWHERREFTYTVRTVVKVMKPCSVEAMNDDYQDVRVLSQMKDYVELEVIHYPFNTNADAITCNPNWRKPSEDVKPYLDSTLTANWDEDMRQDMIGRLSAGGIEVELLTDKEAVEKVSKWLLARGKYRYMFGTYFVHFPSGKPEIFPGLEEAFRREKGNTDLPLEEHFQHELFGKGMYFNKSYGTCTSTAIYLTTGLRTVGIPTRMVLSIPIVDPSDPEQIHMLRDHISHNKVRLVLLSSLRKLSGFVAHTFNEVYVGGRWRRLDYSKLGQNIYGEGAMGMLTHVHTFRDLSEANLVSTWGVRYASRLRDRIFRHQNPYRTTEISDRFGLYCKLQNPEERKHVTITKAYWFFSKERPDRIPEESVKKNSDGHILAHVDASFAQLTDIYHKLNKEFRLVADGHPPIYAQAERGYWRLECYIRIPSEEFSKMIPGIQYKLQPVRTDCEYQWKVKEGVSIIKESTRQ